METISLSSMETISRKISHAFKELRTDKEFTVVTLACEDGKHIEVHKTVLVSSGPFFMEILKIHKHAHPLIYMRGLLVRRFDDSYGLSLSWGGNCPDLDSFLCLAEELQLKGLTGGSQLKDDRCPHHTRQEKFVEIQFIKLLQQRTHLTPNTPKARTTNWLQTQRQM